MEYADLAMGAQNLHENISKFMLRQIVIVRQMVYNIFNTLDTSKALVIGPTRVVSRCSFF